MPRGQTENLPFVENWLRSSRVMASDNFEGLIPIAVRGDGAALAATY
jgi:hypothetical protein